MEKLVFLHIFFMSSALVLVLAAAVVVFRKKKGWFALHRKLALSGVVSAFLGFLFEFALKSVMGYTHFRSPHALGGLLTLGLLLITPATGALMAGNPQKLRPVHTTIGRITLVAVITTAIMGAARFIQLSG